MNSALPPGGVEGSSSGDVFPLTRAQEYHWYRHQLRKRVNVVWWIDLAGPLSPFALEGSLARLICRQEVLRTVFLDIDGAPRQRVRRPWDPTVSVLDLSVLREGPTVRALVDLEERAAAALVPLGRLPLIRWHLIRLAPQKHLLLIAFPAILLDFTSRELLVQNLASDGADPMTASALGVQCSDVAARERLTLGEPEERKAKAAPQGPPLPLDRMPARRGPGRRLRFPLRQLPGAPKALARPGGSADQSWYATLFGLLLARWSGREHAAFDVVVDLREAYDAHNLLGPLTERAPLTFGLPASHSLAAIHWVVSDRLAEHAGSRGNRGGGLGARPSATDWQLGAVLEVQPAPARYRSRELLLQATTPDQESRAADRGALLVHLQTTGEGTVRGFLEIEGALFDGTTGARLRRRFEDLARQAADDPNLELRRLIALPPAEYQQLVYEWRGDAFGLGEDRSLELPLHRHFEEQARLRPQAPAVRSADGELSFREVDEQAGALARWLRTLGVGDGDRVGICVSRQPALAVGMLGALKAGAAYLLLDPDHPVGRLTEVMGSARLDAVISEDSILARLPHLSLPTVCIDPGRPTLGGGRLSSPSLASAPAVITVSFTCGPGLEVVTFPHAAVMAWARAAARLGGEPAAGVGLVAGLGSNLCTVAAWTAWLTGGWWAAKPIPDPPSEDLDLYGAETLHLSPEAMLTGLGLPASTVVFGAGPDLDLWVEQIDGRWPEGRITAVYGSPKGSPLARAWNLSPRGRTLAPAPCPLHLLDRGLRPCGIGTVGSLWIGGGGLPCHIDGEPRGTAERLRPDPFSDLPGARMLATLDRGRLTATGLLDLVGRGDRQVKVGGYRVEPAEIENCLLAHPEVSRALVVPKEGLGEKPRLVAFVVKGPPVGARRRGPLHARPVLPDESRFLDEPMFLEDTMRRILRSRPRRILEVGTEDSGLASRLAVFVEHYLVKAGLGRLGDLEALNGRLPGGARVEGIERRLEDFGGLEKRFDTVVLGPWIRDLPSVELFMGILDGAAGALRPGGTIFLAGVSNERLRRLWHLRRALAQADQSLPVHTLLRRLRTACDDDDELSLSSSFFGALRGSREWLTAVRIIPLRASARRWSPAFQFDAVLSVGPPPLQARAPDFLWRTWDPSLISLEAVRCHLEREEPESLGFTGVPYGSLQGDLKALEELELRVEGSGGTVADVLRARDSVGEPGLDPEDFWRLADDLPYRVDVSWARSGRCGSFDVLIHHRRSEPGPVLWAEMPGPEIRKDPPPWFAREPFRGTAADRFGRHLEAFLATKLPAHLVPRTIVVVPTLPVLAGSSGQPGEGQGASPSSMAGRYAEGPATPTEDVVAGIWGDLLGITDAAVALTISPPSGGVVLATHLSRQLNRCFGIELEPHQVLQGGTVSAVAAAVDALLVERLKSLASEEACRGFLTKSSGLRFGRIRAVQGNGE